jgi:Glycosyl transferase family 41
VIPMLQKKAGRYGIHPSGIVFAPRKAKNEHLNRLRHADLFLDSFIYNAHTTASDMLWTHLPILTLWGSTFASRVAGSLITNAMGTSVFITSSMKEYQDLAVQLALNKHYLRHIRQELIHANGFYPLFDTNRTARYIEDAYESIIDLKAINLKKKMNLVIQPLKRKQWMIEPSERKIGFRLSEAIEFHLQGQFDIARNQYIRLLRLDSKKYTPDLLQLMGGILLASNKVVVGILYIRRSIQMNKNISGVFENLSYGYKKLGIQSSMMH